jgi:hypothetical protein
MGDYRTKPIRVEAVEWNEAILKPTAYGPLAPFWFLGAVDPSYGNARLCGKIKQVGEKLQVITDKGTTIAEVGDWVVYWSGSDHHFSVHKWAEFDRMFDEDTRRAKIRSTTEKPRRGGWGKGDED